eukprot:1376628-Pyramimonas_sp.AAC.1
MHVIDDEVKTRQSDLDLQEQHTTTREPCCPNPTSSDSAPAPSANRPLAIEVAPQRPSGWPPIATITRKE